MNLFTSIFKTNKFGYLSVYKWIFSYLKPYRNQVGLFLSLGIAVTLFEMIIPKGVQYIIDVIIPQQDFRRLIYFVAFMLVLVLLITGITVWKNSVQRSIQEYAAKDIQWDVFRKSRELGFAYFERTTIGETLSMVGQEVESVQKMYRLLIPELVKQGLIMSVVICIILTIHLELSLLLLPCLLIYYVLSPKFERRAAYYTKLWPIKRKLVLQKAHETLNALTEIRIFGRQLWAMERFVNVIDEFLFVWKYSMLFNLLRNSFRQFTVYTGIIAVFLYGLFLVNHQEITVGGFSAFLFYYFILINSVAQFLTVMMEQRLLIQNASQLYSFMNLEPEVKETSNPCVLGKVKKEILFEEVSFRYPSRPELLSGLNLRIEANRKTALVGTSGGGKSTIIKLLCRFYEVTGGRITLDGIPIKQLSLKGLREEIGIVHQENFIFGGSVMENIAFGRGDATREEIIQAAKSAECHDFIMELEHGYDTIVGERGLVLSGGQKQRIALARLFLKNPSVIILDEATSALDNLTEKKIQKAICKLAENRTVITIAHRLTTIKDYDKIIVLHKGRVVEEGTYDELVKSRGFFYSLLLSGEYDHV
ncbi:ABC transporter ATP-binding protein [Paenibacillus aceti]|uniref:ABC transporter ATP-binding protein YknV n=1 Tax=Paenibacillus aceti TaxID=1820010 RepID=A0ABQ1W7L6_9BACL|nr:ABC transporter ATP-binding protein [Paenibacillus aceti]GGG17891.1 putative ABC transporter ATP-binding protein YknV [Paenibacillus aceti]